MIKTHFGQHGDSCFGCRVQTVNIGASCTPTRSGKALEYTATEKQWDKDFAAYKTLRGQGYQPKSSTGAHELAQRATTRDQIEGTPKGWHEQGLKHEFPGV